MTDTHLAPAPREALYAALDRIAADGEAHERTRTGAQERAARGVRHLLLAGIGIRRGAAREADGHNQAERGQDIAEAHGKALG